MKNFGFLLPILVLLMACNSSDDGLTIDGTDFLVFGHFYGECGGEGCVETFKLTDQALFEDTVDDYNGQQFNFLLLEDSLFEQVKDLEGFFPGRLLTENTTVFGCPDCADGGGLFVQYAQNGNVRSWRIDQVKANVPEYLHEFMDQINAKIALINPQ